MIGKSKRWGIYESNNKESGRKLRFLGDLEWIIYILFSTLNITLHYISLHYITLHYITLQYIILHYIYIMYILYIMLFYFLYIVAWFVVVVMSLFTLVYYKIFYRNIIKFIYIIYITYLILWRRHRGIMPYPPWYKHFFFQVYYKEWTLLLHTS